MVISELLAAFRLLYFDPQLSLSQQSEGFEGKLEICPAIPHCPLVDERTAAAQSRRAAKTADCETFHYYAVWGN